MAHVLTREEALDRLASGFKRSVDDLLPAGIVLTDADVSELASRAAIEAAGRKLWESAIGDTLGWRDVAQRLQVNSRQAVHGRFRRGGLIGLVEPSGQLAFPAWQFRPGDGVYQHVPEVIAAFRAEGVTDQEALISWCATAQAGLDGLTAREWMAQERPIGPLVRAARHSAFQLAA